MYNVHTHVQRHLIKGTHMYMFEHVHVHAHCLLHQTPTYIVHKQVFTYNVHQNCSCLWIYKLICVALFQPSTPLEQEVYKILHGSRHNDRPNKQLTLAEEDALTSLSVEEVCCKFYLICLSLSLC